MKPRTLTTAALAAVLIVAAASTASAGRNLFISDDGGETYDLADLYDGETRTFGEGEHAVTVVREGDSVRIAGMGDEVVPEVSCNLGTDTCKVVTMGDGGKTMVMVMRDLECGEGQDCRMIDIDNLAFGEGVHGEGHTFMWKGVVNCDDGDDCDDVNVIIDGAGSAGAMGNLMHLRMIDDGRVTVRCPEGDTTMRLDSDDEGAVFLCPKHSLPLEKLKAESRSMHRIELRGTPHQH